MRRLFLFIMIALLPLRGWVGDAMAVEMAAQSLYATEIVATYEYTTRATGQFDSKNAAPAHAECPGHAALALGPAAESTDTVAPADVAYTAATAATTATTADDATNGHCNTCGVCQICHSVALANAVALSPPDFIPQTRPAASSIRFASALTALGQKPPIS